MTQVNLTKAITEARELLAKSKTNGRFPVNLITILRELNLKLMSKEAGIKDGQMMDEALLDPSMRTIYIREDGYPLTSKMFPIAHEIGHWILHSNFGQDKKVRYLTYDTTDVLTMIEEQEANAFAAELLMPYEKTEELIFKGYDVDMLANFFLVSRAVAQDRFNFIKRRYF